jgi:hypothetical protein
MRHGILGWHYFVPSTKRWRLGIAMPFKNSFIALMEDNESAKSRKKNGPREDRSLQYISIILSRVIV